MKKRKKNLIRRFWHRLLTATKKFLAEVKAVIQWIVAGIYTLGHDRNARDKLCKNAGKAFAFILIGFLVGTEWLRMIDFKAEDEQQTAVQTPIIIKEPNDEVKAEALTLVQAAHEQTLDRQAEEIAKVLYGIRKNSERDLRAVVWVILNRVDSPIYPDTLEEVIAQPQQWVCYFESNPATKELTALAKEELINWENDTNRPVSRDTLWLDWSPEGITFKENF